MIIEKHTESKELDEAVQGVFAYLVVRECWYALMRSLGSSNNDLTLRLQQLWNSRTTTCSVE